MTQLLPATDIAPAPPVFEQRVIPASRTPWWPTLKRVLAVLLLVAVLGLLGWNARHVDWPAVGAALRDYSASTLALACLLTLGSFAVYSCFDLLARSYTRELMSVGSVMTVTFVSHALGLVLGVAGVALRFRLYGAYGVAAASVARIWGLSVLTNWLGFVVLGAVVFTGGFLQFPSGGSTGTAASAASAIGANTLRGIGVGLVALTVVYLAVCAVARGREFTVFGRRLTAPSFMFAARQFVLSSVNWTLIAGVMYVLLRGKVDFPTVLAVYLLSAIALSVIDVPGGFGVTEAVFLAMLGDRVPIHDLLAALVVYRAVFYLAPVIPAALVYLTIEARQRSRAQA